MNFINPLTLLVVPLLGALIIAFYPVASLKESLYLSGKETTEQSLKLTMTYWKEQDKDQSNLKKIAILVSLLNFIISICLWIQFDPNYIGYQFTTSLIPSAVHPTVEFIQLNLGIDGISLFFVLLTTFITPIALLSSHRDIEKNLKFYLVSILLLETLQIAVFVVLDLLLFYVFFESVLIPLFFIVGVWGASSAKVRAAFLLFLYTLFGSLFMLLAIIQIYSYLGSTDFALLSVSEISLDSQKILWLNNLLQQQVTDHQLLYVNVLLAQKNIKKDNSLLTTWGTNLSSNIHYKPYNSNLKHLFEFPFSLECVLTGILLSDGFLKKNKYGNTTFYLKQSLKNFKYLWFVFNKFSHYCSSYPSIVTTNIKGKKYFAVYFCTRSFPFLSDWYNMFYIDSLGVEGRKNINSIYIYNLLTYEAIAHWIMGDGNKLGTGCILNTQSFTVEECTILISILNYKYGLECNIYYQRGLPVIYIRGNSMRYLSTYIRPYFIPSMVYKLHTWKNNTKF